MFELIYVYAPLISNDETVKTWNLMRIFLFSKVCLATLQFNSISVIIWLSGRISPTIRPDSRVPEKQGGAG